MVGLGKVLHLPSFYIPKSAFICAYSLRHSAKTVSRVVRLKHTEADAMKCIRGNSFSHSLAGFFFFMTSISDFFLSVQVVDFNPAALTQTYIEPNTFNKG